MGSVSVTGPDLEVASVVDTPSRSSTSDSDSAAQVGADQTVITGDQNTIIFNHSPERDIFISYTATDRAWAEWVAWTLEEAGYTVLIMPWDFVPGTNFIDAMRHALDRAHITIAIVSTAYFESTFAQAEWTQAQAKSAYERAPRLIPVRVESCELPLLLRSVVGIDLFDLGKEQARARLLDGIQAASGRAKPTTAPRFPAGEPAGEGADPRPSRDQSDNGRTLALICHPEHFRIADELATRLDSLKTEGLIQKIVLDQGELDRQMDLVASLSNAHIIVFLITHDFMADKLITSSRLDDFLVANTRKRVTAISVLVDQIVAWENEAISRLPRLPTDGVPLSGWKKRSQAFSNIVEGIRQAALDTIEDREWRIDGQNNANTPVGAQRLDLGEVFPVVGLPDVTFVEPDKYLPFRMAIRQKGLGIVLEGPSGVGKTTLLRSVLTRDSSRVGVFRILSARNPLHAAEIKELPRTGHEGLIAIDDFHRLEPEDRQAISDYLKLTADAGEAGRLVLIGIPGIGQHLVDLNYDLANRIRVLKLGRVSDERIMELITRGEQALNIRFERKSEIVAACAGSLLTAQAICGHLASIAHIEETMPQLTVVRTDLPSARARVAEEVAIKYEPIVKKFAQLDRSHEDACIQILIEVAQSIDGHLALESFVKENGAYSETISGVFFTGPLSGGVNDADMLRHIFYDHQARRLIIDDPQLIFYLRELSASGMRELVGKTLPVPREQVFVCYSRRDSVWLDRLRAHLKPFENRQRIDVWSDRRIELGDNWLNEIQDALARARFALLLVSADFLASDFISQVELPALLAAAKDGGCRVIPILVKASAFMEIDELSLFQHPSLQGKTLSSMPEEEAEEVLAKVAREVARFSKQPTRS